MKLLFLGVIFSLAMLPIAQAQNANDAAFEQNLLFTGGGHGGGGHGGGSGHGGGHGPGHGGGGGHHPLPGGHPGPGHWHGGVWAPHPGWHAGWRWNPGWYPFWWRVGIIFPIWVWYPTPVGFWQCTAFNGQMQSFSAIGPDMHEAAYGALYKCGGPNYQAMGCYIPPGYCQVRY